MQKIEIEDVERLVIKPGEMLVVTIREDISQEDADYIKKVIEANLPEGVKTLVKTRDIELKVIAESHG